MAIKLLELTQFASPNLSIYFNFVWCWVRCDKVRFYMHRGFIEKSIMQYILLHFLKINLVINFIVLFN